MTRKPIVAVDTKLVGVQPTCIRAVFHPSDSNPLLPVMGKDDRGTLYCLDYTTVRPLLVEVIHSRPGAVRGNHIHRKSTELFTVLLGSIEMYLLCDCPEKHLLRTQMSAGASVEIAPGIAHAVYALTKNESVVVFGDNDPRSDRERVELLTID